MGVLNGVRVGPEIEDAVVGHFSRLHERSGITLKKLLHIVALKKGKDHQWRKRYGKPNGHNSAIPRKHWLMPEEVAAIKTYAKEHYAEIHYHLCDGYRRLAYSMMDKGIAAASPSTVYRTSRKQACAINGIRKKEARKTGWGSISYQPFIISGIRITNQPAVRKAHELSRHVSVSISVLDGIPGACHTMKSVLPSYFLIKVYALEHYNYRPF